jgi:hypothetical protein
MMIDTSSPDILNQKVQIIKPAALMKIDITGSEVEVINSLMFEILQENLDTDDLETAKPQIAKLHAELQKAVATRDISLPFWKYQYLTLRNIKGRADVEAVNKNLLEEVSLPSLMGT